MSQDDRDLWIGVALGAVAVIVLLKFSRKCGCNGPAKVIPFPSGGSGTGSGSGAVTVRRHCSTDALAQAGARAGFGDYAQGAGPESPVFFHG